MHRFELRHYCWFYLLLVFIAETIENQGTCETIYFFNDRILKCEKYNETDPPYFGDREKLKECNFEMPHGYRSKTNPTNMHLENGFCSLGPGSFRFLQDKNIDKFSSRSKYRVLPNFTFSGLCKLQHIDLSESAIEIIEAESFDCVKLVRRLNLSNNKMQNLTKNAFKEMRELRELYLNGNRLRTFALGTFDDLPLERLDLHNNSIFHLPDGIFRRLSLLKDLDLHSNKLENLGPQLLADLTGLQVLQLFNNELKSLSNSFSNNYNLTTLSIDRNFELNITADAFVGLDNLNKLYMSECNLKFLPPGLLSRTPKLSWINLNRNRLEVISTEMFSSLKDLEVLYLDSNSISELREPFKSNKNLGKITLVKNKLSVIEEDDFRGLSLLKYLDLSSNAIEKIAVGSFNELSVLKHLDLERNRITCLQGNSSFYGIMSNGTGQSNYRINNLANLFENNKCIENLNMNENPLILSNHSFIGLSKLRHLSLQNCGLTSLPSDAFKTNPVLYHVDLYGNNLNEITRDTFEKLNYLTLINITSNNISILRDQPFKNQKNLLRLSLDNNKLSEIKRDYFEGLSSLLYLDISGNVIIKIANNSFDHLPNLEILNLQHNQLISVSGFHSFRNNIKLKKIDVSHNKLTNIWEINLEHLKHLVVLKASHNEMTKLMISEILPGNRYLRIHLESNKIRHLHTGSEQRNSMQAEIYLSGNPLQCDCHNYALHEVLNGSDFLPHIKFADGLICQSPFENKWKSLNKLKPTDFACNITENCPDGCICPYIPHNRTQLVNCNNQSYSNLPTQAPVNTNVLYIRKNALISLSRLRDSLWENLTELYSDDNLIESEEFVIPKTLKILSLRGNKLIFLPDTVKRHVESEADFEIAISNNVWSCDCSVFAFKTWLKKYSKQVTDISEVRCVLPNNSLSNVSLTMMEDSELCPFYFFVYIIVAAIPLLFILFYYKYKLYVLSFIYTHCNCFYTIFCCNRPKEEDKLFDCFISYSDGDRDVTLAILQELEAKPPNYKFCIHERNWMPGRYITNNIILSVQNSRKTLIILSESFLKSQWFQLEFQAAYYQTLEDKVDRLIIILVGDMPDKSGLAEDVSFVISWKTYLVWGEKWFWEKLRYALYVETSLTKQQNKCSLYNWLSCFRGKSDQNHQNIPMSEDLSSAIKV